MNVEMRRFGAANEESGCRLELKVRETRTRTWHRPAPQRHTVWPPKRAVVSIAIGCCRGAPLASDSVPPAGSSHDAHTPPESLPKRRRDGSDPDYRAPDPYAPVRLPRARNPLPGSGFRAHSARGRRSRIRSRTGAYG